MQIIKIDETISRIADIVSLSHRMQGLETFASTPPLHQALVDLANLLSNNVKWALCGGLAVGVRVKPRGTEDIDIVLESDAEIDNVERLTRSLFKHNRPHALIHKKLGVEVDLVTPEHVKIDSSLVSTAINTSTIVNLGGINIPTVTKEGLIALKLGRGSDFDTGDIKMILRNNKNIDLSMYNLNEKDRASFEKIKKEISNEVVVTEKDLE